jgi:hypothetical protein
MDDDDESGAIGGMLGKGNRSILRKPALVPLCPPHIPHVLTWAQTRATMVESQQLRALAWHGLYQRIYSHLSKVPYLFVPYSQFYQDHPLSEHSSDSNSSNSEPFITFPSCLLLPTLKTSSINNHISGL